MAQLLQRLVLATSPLTSSANVYRCCLRSGAQGLRARTTTTTTIFGLGRQLIRQSTSSSSTTSSALSGAARKRNAAEMKKLIKLWEPEKWRLTGAIGLLLVSSIVSMSVPFALGKIIDIIYKIDQSKDAEEQKKDFELNLRKLCLGLTAIFLVGGACNFGRVYLMRISAQNITARLRSLLYGSVMGKGVPFFDKNKTGELVNRLSADSQLVSQTITQQVSDGLRSVVMTSAGVGMMFFMSPQLAMVGLGIVPPVALWAVMMGRKVRAASRQVQDTLADATQLAEERISNIRTVSAFAKQPQEIAAYDGKMSTVLDVSTKEAWIHAKFYGMTGLSGNMIILSVLYYGGSLVTSDVLTVGNLTSFVLYAAYVGIGLSGVSTFYAEVMKGLGASGRIFEIVESEADAEEAKRREREVVGGSPVSSSRGSGDPLVKAAALDLSQSLYMKDIHFRYPGRPDMKIFDGLNLTVPAKKVLAVVGSSGSGKSTLGALLLRFYEPERGSISIGEVDISTIDVYNLRQKIGTVTQEPVLFSTSIRENICYGCDDATNVSQEDVEKAAREANAHNFIMEFPQAYDTLVGERGVLLSGGQKQRVAIARAIIKNPEILLLDEATSALDAASEHLVKEALQRVMHGRTVITIAHRLSTIMHADKIVVLRGGKIVEEGTFDELNGLEGGYFKMLVTKQTIGGDS